MKAGEIYRKGRLRVYLFWEIGLSIGWDDGLHVGIPFITFYWQTNG
jgi:hypothetical protein